MQAEELTEVKSGWQLLHSLAELHWAQPDTLQERQDPLKRLKPELQPLQTFPAPHSLQLGSQLLTQVDERLRE
jgi:hypothetical protein